MVALWRHGNVLGHSDGPLSRAKHRRNVNIVSLDVVFHYIKLILVINDSKFVISGLDLLILSSDSVDK